MKDLAVTYYSHENASNNSGWMKELLDKNPDMLFLLVVYNKPKKDSGSFLMEYAERINYAILDNESPLHAQANEVLIKTQEILPETIHLIPHENFPAGLFEEINIAKEQQKINIWEHRPKFLVFDPQLKETYDPVGLQQILVHKDKKAVLEWQDLEFCYELFDEEELEEVKRALLIPRSLLILGDTGTGKTLLARYIHFHSSHTASGKFIERNAAVIPETLIESEIFGILAGISTGFDAKKGWIELADKGTLFLDEIAESSENLQKKLLRVITEKLEPIKIDAIGSTESTTVLTRFIAATNVPERDLDKKMREDLLNRFPIRIHLKNLYEKEPDGFHFVKRAINHFASYELRYNPLKIPEWDWKILKDLYDKKQLPSSLRGLRSYISYIFERRKLGDNKPWEIHISKDEIISALPEENYINKSTRQDNTDSTVNVKFLKSIINEIENSNNLDGLSKLSDSEAMELVFLIKKLALNIALQFAPTNKNRAKAIYAGATSSYPTFKGLFNNPYKLHPDKRLRK